ncbi:MAG TPA: hypothetical protein VK856_09190 [Anaerolineaceae bacterium]|nr:hypothetical protein [Anaerolineaceae bacterium]
MDKKKLPVLSTVLYFIAGLLVVYSVWTVVYSVNYISTMIQQGQLAFSGNEFEIVSFYMSNTAQYVLFAIILLVLGKILLYFSYIEEEADIDATLESSIEENGKDDDKRVETDSFLDN